MYRAYLARRHRHEGSPPQLDFVVFLSQPGRLRSSLMYRAYLAGKSVFLALRFCSRVNPRRLDPRPLAPFSHPSTTRDLPFAYPYTPSKFIPLFCGR